MLLPTFHRMISYTPLRNKIVLIGSGQIGSVLGLLAGMKRLGDVHLVDIMPGVSEGKALDLNQLTAIEKLPVKYEGHTNYEAIRDASVAIITAGVPRKPGMSRTDLLTTNAKVIKAAAHAIKKYSPNAFVICVTNPLDAMVHLFHRESQLPAQKVVGMAGILDSARFNYFLSQKLNISIENIQTLVLGGHADSMVPIPRYSTVAGIPLPDLIKMKYLTQQELDDIIRRTRFGGQEIVELLKTGSAFFTPAASAIQMAEAYLHDKKMILPCAAQLNGEYGVNGYYVGVPVLIGAKGVEKVIELSLTSDEMKAFQNSVDEVKKIVAAMNDIEKQMSTK